MRKKVPLLVLVALTIALMLSVGTAYAIFEETEPIDSQMGRVYALNDPYCVQLVANITSWYRVRIIPSGMFEWEWITFDPAMLFCETSGTIFIGFESYITIQTFSITLSCGEGSYVTHGGVGYSWLEIDITGTSFWHFYLKTNYIPDSHWGQTTPITLSAITGGCSNTTIVNLQI
jgi:hypothetical protein